MRQIAETIAGLNATTLPGYGSPASLDDVLHVSQPAMSMLIASANELTDKDPTGFKILTSVRGGEQYEYNQWAISVATTELGHDDAKGILEETEDWTLIDAGVVHIPRIPDDTEAELSTHRRAVKTYRANPRPLSLVHQDGESRLVTVTRNLLQRKYDLSERAERKGLSGTVGSVSLHHIEVGFVGADGERIEFNTNFSVAARVSRELMGGDSSGYLSSAWVDPEDFMGGFANSRPEQLNPGLDGLALAFVCRRGMCLRSAVDALGDLSLLREHLTLNA